VEELSTGLFSFP